MKVGGGGVGLKGVDDAGTAADAVARLRKPGSVVVPNLRLRAYDSPAATRLFAVQWALHNRFKPGADVNWDAVADRVATAPTPLIGLVDSGIDLDDDRLRPTAWTNPQPGDFEGLRRAICTGGTSSPTPNALYAARHPPLARVGVRVDHRRPADRPGRRRGRHLPRRPGW